MPVRGGWSLRLDSRGRQPLLLLAGAGLCVLCVVGGAARLPAGVVLCLYLPGQLAVEALFPRPGSRSLEWYQRVMLALAVSLGITALVGLVVALAGVGFGATPVSLGVLGACVLLTVAAVARGGRPGTGGEPRWTGPAERSAGSAARRTGPAERQGWVVASWVAAVPVVVLTGALGVQIVGAARHRVPDSYFTELFVGRSGGTVVVQSREAVPMGFRAEERVDGTVAGTTPFVLRPGERREIAVPGGGGRVEVWLYRGQESEPYRRVVLKSG